MSDDMDRDSSETDQSLGETADGSFGKQQTSVDGYDRVEEISDEEIRTGMRSEDLTGTDKIDSDLLERALELDELMPALIELSGTRAGEVTLIDGPEMLLGRDPERVDFLLQDSSVSRVHAALVVSEENDARIRDLESSNGTFVNGTRIEGEHALSDGDRITLGTQSKLTFRLLDPYEVEYQRQLFESKIRDELTGANSRAYLEEQMWAEMSFADRHDTPLCLALFDVDEFKDVNDRYGHVAGDQLLSQFADIVEAQLRTEDLFARYGGDEFAVLLRKTDEETARQVAERIRAELSAADFDLEGHTVSTTVSIGVAAYDTNEMEDLEDWFRAADTALYEAKESGRNQIQVYGPNS